MSELLDKLLREARAKGYAEGYAEVQTECMVHDIRAVMENLNVTAEKAMDLLKVPESERETYRKLLAQ